MADKECLVTITKQGKTCNVDPKHFVVGKGGFVTFKFDEPGARITFVGESPFELGSFEPARMPLRSNAPLANDYKFNVTWPADGGGRGDGTGEIRP